MRINEDYLDDIEIDDLQTDVRVNADMDTREFMYQFTFCTKEMTKGKEPQWYISRMERFYDIFMKMLDKLAFIKDYSHEFPINFGWFIDNDYDEQTTESGLRFRYRHDEHVSYDSIRQFFFASPTNKFHFVLGIDCKKIDTLEDIQRTLLMLWNVFEGCLKIAFRSGCKPSHIRYFEPRQFPGCAQIDDGSVSVWKNKPDDKHSKKIFQDAYRAFHQEMKPKQILPIVDAFCGEQLDVKDALKQFGLYGWWFSEVVNNTEKASLDGDTLVLDITKRIIIRESFIRDIRAKRIKLRIRYLKNISYLPYSGEFTPVEDYEYNLNWFINNIAPSVEKITLTLDPTALVDFQDVPLDLTKMFPGKRVEMRLKSTSALHYKYPGKGRKCIVPDHDFSATVITSAGKKKYNIHVAESNVRF